MEKNKLCVWLFCRVIDNFGDIGVAWRLAKQLQREQNMEVVLWLDDWQALKALLPDVGDEACTYEGVKLCFWSTAQTKQGLQQVPMANAVIETFACDLPDAVLQWMASHEPVVWLNLEYLTAEKWVDDIHLLPSLQQNGLSKHFFCPGFTEQTGGVSYEQELLTKNLPVGAMQKNALRQIHGLPQFEGDVHVYLFGYADEMWVNWFDMWMQVGQSITVWLAPGAVLEQIKQHFLVFQSLNQVGDVAKSGHLRVCVVPFVAQSQFDEVLQAADVCVVRGEDSVLRALWQGQVFWWQIYRQEDNAHHVKLKAFWQRFMDDVGGLQDACVASVWAAHQLLSDELNGVKKLTVLERQEAWQMVFENQIHLIQLITKWRQSLWQKPSLTTQLANFIRHQLK